MIAKGLERQLAEFKAQFARAAPAGRGQIDDLRTSFALEEAIGVNDEAPDFGGLDSMLQFCASRPLLSF